MIEERSTRLLEALEGRTETLLGLLQEERARGGALQAQLVDLERRLAESEASRLELVEENRELDEQNRELEEHNRHLYECLAGNERAAGFARPARRSQGLSALIGQRTPPQAPPAPVGEAAEPRAEAPTAETDGVSPAAGQGDLPIGEAPSPQALLDDWYQRYGTAFFKGHTRPLKVGIHEELAAREPWPEKLVRRALACYVNLPRYLKAVREGAERIDLAGHPAGRVDAQAAEHAKRKLDRLQGSERRKQGGRPRGGRGRAKATVRQPSPQGGEHERVRPAGAAPSPAPEPAEGPPATGPASFEEKLSALVAKHNRR